MEPADGFVVNQVLDAHWGVLNEEDVSFVSAIKDQFSLPSSFFSLSCNRGFFGEESTSLLALRYNSCLTVVADNWTSLTYSINGRQ